MADDKEEQEGGYRWETGYEKTWEAIEEDAHGFLDSAVNEIIERSKRKRLQQRRAAGRVCLGIMRHVYIIVDLSKCMTDQDLKPNRILATVKILERFLDEFFDSNPISQLGIIGTRNKRAEKISDMSGNPRKHLEVLQTLVKQYPCEGEPSLQNSLEMALSFLKQMPRHTSREIIVIHGSLTTVDPGDINETIETLKKYGIRCSVISLAAEVRACKSLTKKTGGSFGVILDDGHFRDLIYEHVEPPPMSMASESSLIQMGFPQRNQEVHSAMCLCHADDDPSKCKLSTGGYICPRCLNKCCELPTECKACGLTMVSAPHLARSFLHMFPLDPFEELPAVEVTCFGCNAIVNPATSKHIYACKVCRNRFCLECDLFLHEILHSCPGCSLASVAASSSSSAAGRHHAANATSLH